MKIEISYEDLQNIHDAVFHEAMRWSQEASETGSEISKSIAEDYSALLNKIRNI